MQDPNILESYYGLVLFVLLSHGKSHIVAKHLLAWLEDAGI
jgi:hypothetical protein